MKILKYKVNFKGTKIVTPCPHAFGWLRKGVWGLGAAKPVMVGSSICELDCPHNGGVNKAFRTCVCNNG